MSGPMIFTTIMLGLSLSFRRYFNKVAPIDAEFDDVATEANTEVDELEHSLDSEEILEKDERIIEERTIEERVIEEPVAQEYWSDVYLNIIKDLEISASNIIPKMLKDDNCDLQKQYLEILTEIENARNTMIGVREKELHRERLAGLHK